MVIGNEEERKWSNLGWTSDHIILDIKIDRRLS